jgi:hypothetical protein
MFDISNELSTKTIKRLYFYSVTVFLFLNIVKSWEENHR